MGGSTCRWYLVVISFFDLQFWSPSRAQPSPARETELVLRDMYRQMRWKCRAQRRTMHVWVLVACPHKSGGTFCSVALTKDEDMNGGGSVL